MLDAILMGCAFEGYLITLFFFVEMVLCRNIIITIPLLMFFVDLIDRSKFALCFKFYYMLNFSFFVIHFSTKNRWNKFCYFGVFIFTCVALAPFSYCIILCGMLLLSQTVLLYVAFIMHTMDYR